ncbi:MAG: hypothetical protein AB7N76_34375 [Planctomycetota bacterium]
MERATTRPEERERGGGLLLVMIATVVVALLVEGLLAASLAQARQASGEAARTRSLYAALAGVTAASNDLATGAGGDVRGNVADPSYVALSASGDLLDELTGAAAPDGWPDTTPDASFRAAPPGSFEVRAKDLGGGERYRVLAKGAADGEVRVLEAVLVRQPLTRFPFTRGLFSDAGIQVSSNPVIDSFASSLGSYASQYDGVTQHAGEQGGVASNGDIALGSNTQVWGDVHPGPGGAISYGSGAYASGETAPLVTPEENPLPAWTVPAASDPGVDVSLGYDQPLVLSTPGTVTLGPGKYVFSRIELNDNGASLVLSGTAADTIEIYITGGGAAADAPSLFLRKGNLTLEAAGVPEGVPTVKILSAGKLETQATTGINYTGSAPTGTEGPPTHFQYYSTYQSDPTDPADVGVKLGSPSALSGVVYAPGALVEVASNGHIYGAVVGKQARLSSNCQLHYDTDLASFPAGGLPPRYIFPVAVLRVLR